MPVEAAGESGTVPYDLKGENLIFDRSRLSAGLQPPKMATIDDCGREKGDFEDPMIVCCVVVTG
jgi:hypothetical protein